ncbi:MAG: efflux RND transporter periplasmic adaptor subunit [Myxococcota bacterium]
MFHPRSLLMAALVAAGCGGSSDPAATPTPSAVLSRADVVVVGQEAIQSGPRISGTLEPAQKAVIRAEASGSVLEVNVEIGETVTEKQVLGRIDAAGTGDLWRSAQSGVSSAEQDLKVAERELARTQRLFDAGAVAPRDLELSQSQFASAQARLQAARAQQSSAGSQLGRTTLRSPIAGVVSERAVNLGDVVSMGAPMFTVIEPSSLRLEGSVPATAIGSLAVGTPVSFEVQGYPGRTFDGTIQRISPAVDPTSRQIPILVSIPNESGTLVSGLFAEGRIASEQRQGLVVPASAVDRTGPAPFVMKIVDDTVQKAEVGLGIVDEAGEQVELTSGVAVGDVLILGGARDVKEGSAVTIQGGETAAASDGNEG